MALIPNNELRQRVILMDHSKCANLFEASKALLRRSGLIRWEGAAFVAAHLGKDDSAFEKYAQAKFDPTYGRYMCWVLLSVGAENLAKAACVCNGIVPGKVSNLGYPIYENSMLAMDWANKVLSKSWSEGDPPQAEKYYYGTLDAYWKTHFKKLCKKPYVGYNDRKLLIAGYKYLTQAIRNRDAHTYIADQRRRDFPAVEPIFVPSFNVLVKTMKDNGHFKEPHHA